MWTDELKYLCLCLDVNCDYVIMPLWNSDEGNGRKMKYDWNVDKMDKIENNFRRDFESWTDLIGHF